MISDILKMGHSLGVDSHSHISGGASRLTQEDFKRKIIEPTEDY